MSEDIISHFKNLGNREGEVHAPAALPLREATCYSFYMRLNVPRLGINKVDFKDTEPENVN